MTGGTLRRVAVLGFVMAAAMALAAPAAADGTPTATGTPAPSPAGTPWPQPTGIELTSTATLINPDGSFIPLEQRTWTNTITWGAVSGFTGFYDVQRAQTRRDSSGAKDFKQINVLPAAAARQGKVSQADTVQFLDQLSFQFCYRVRTAINGETSPYSAEVCTIVPPFSGPVPAARTSVPGHPLRVLFGPQPAGTGTNNALPDVSALPFFANLAELRRVAPRSLPAALDGYWLVDAAGSAGQGRFAAQARFRGEGDRLLVIRSWTKTGDFVMTVPANSPVTDVQQTYIEGLAALTLMPTRAVVGGIGPRWMYMTDGATIWYLDFLAGGYSDNAEALAVAAQVARAVQSPGAPNTGSGIAPSDDGPAISRVLSGLAVAAIGAALLLVARRRTSR